MPKKKHPIELSKLQAAILSSLLDGRRIHGLELLSLTEARIGKAISGSFYKSTAALEAAGMIEASWERKGIDPAHGGPPRHYHRITAHGAKTFREYLQQLQDEFARLNSLRRVDDSPPRPKLGNLVS